MRAPNTRRWRGGAAEGDVVLENDLFEAMLSLRERDGEAFDALLEFAKRVAALAAR